MADQDSAQSDRIVFATAKSDDHEHYPQEQTCKYSQDITENIAGRQLIKEKEDDADSSNGNGKNFFFMYFVMQEEHRYYEYENRCSILQNDGVGCSCQLVGCNKADQNTQQADAGSDRILAYIYFDVRIAHENEHYQCSENTAASGNEKWTP